MDINGQVYPDDGYFRTLSACSRYIRHEIDTELMREYDLDSMFEPARIDADDKSEPGTDAAIWIATKHVDGRQELGAGGRFFGSEAAARAQAEGGERIVGISESDGRRPGRQSARAEEAGGPEGERHEGASWIEKVRERSRRNRATLEAEAERLREDPGPPLEATPVDGMRDWTKQLGVLYGTPTKVGDGWGVSIHPTRQQEALLDKRREEHQAGGAYDDNYMIGMPAASIDRSGRVRALTIVDASRGWSYDMYGNISIGCRTSPREPARENPTTATVVVPGDGRVSGNDGQSATRKVMQEHADRPLVPDGGRARQENGPTSDSRPRATGPAGATRSRRTATGCADPGARAASNPHLTAEQRVIRRHETNRRRHDARRHREDGAAGGSRDDPEQGTTNRGGTTRGTARVQLGRQDAEPQSHRCPPEPGRTDRSRERHVRRGRQLHPQAARAADEQRAGAGEECPPASLTMPLILNDLGQRIAHWLEAEEWAAGKAAGSARRARSLPDWRIDDLAREVADGPLGTEFERRVAACAYEFGMTPGDVRAVLRVLLRDTLIAGEGRTPPAPKDCSPRYGEAPAGPAGWRKVLGDQEGPRHRSG